MKCQNCKNDCLDTAKFCMHCGHKLINTCPNCQQVAEKGAMECSKCGHSFIRTDVSKPTNPDVCGAYIETRICTKCGKQFTKEIFGRQIESPEPIMCDACREKTWAPFYSKYLPDRRHIIVGVEASIPHSITIPEAVSIIYDQAFVGTDITEVKLPPRSNIVIGNLAFANCKNLEKFDCADSCIYFEEDAFLNCDKLDMSSLKNARGEGEMLKEALNQYRSYKLIKQLEQRRKNICGERSVDDFLALHKAIFGELPPSLSEKTNNQE